MKKRILALTLALSLLLTACGGGASATTMRLKKTDGTVGVSDDEGKDVTPRDDLGLYSGYGVDTQTESYAWISLDEAKLTKLDQDSEIAITKEGKYLEIDVKSGSLFFNVTQPLADDESMNIRTSTMALGIRGTCGWVVSNGKRGAQVFLLEGTVEAKATDTGETVQVTAGNMAEVTVNESGETEITVYPFAEEYIPPFVLTELENDDALSAAILEASGLDALNPPDPAERLRAEYLDIINSRPILDKYAANGIVYKANELQYASEGLSYATIFDFDGNGTDELVLVTQYGPWSLTKLEVYGESQGHAALYGEANLSMYGAELGWDDPYYAPSHFCLAESNGTLYAVVTYGIQDFQGSLVYAIENSKLTLVEHTGYDEYVDDQYIANLDLTEERNICPPLPKDVQMKNALLSCLETYATPYHYYYAKLANTDLYALEVLGDFDKFSWNGTEIEYTNLENNIIYAKLIDMDQDGEEELLFIMDDYQAVAYSWKGTSWERTLIHGEVLTFPYEGLYRDTVTGNVFLYDTEWRHIGEGEACSFNGLTDRFEYYYSAGDFSANGGNFVHELTPDELEEFYQAVEQYQRDLARFELIENIDLSENNYEWIEELQPTVDEVRQQLMSR